MLTCHCPRTFEQVSRWLVFKFFTMVPFWSSTCGNRFALNWSTVWTELIPLILEFPMKQGLKKVCTFHTSDLQKICLRIQACVLPPTWSDAICDHAILGPVLGCYSVWMYQMEFLIEATKLFCMHGSWVLFSFLIRNWYSLCFSCVDQPGQGLSKKRRYNSTPRKSSCRPRTPTSTFSQASPWTLLDSSIEGGNSSLYIGVS